VSEGRLILVSGVSISHHTAESLASRPRRDFVVLRDMYDVDIVDEASCRSLHRPLGKLIARACGPSWVIAASALRRSRPGDVLMAMGDDVGVPLSFLALVRKRPILIVGQHLRGRRPRVLWGRLHLHRRVTRFLANSTAQVRIVTEEMKFPAERVRLFWDHVDHEFFTPEDGPVHDRQVCSAGLAHRDYPTLIEATRGTDIQVKIEANSAWLQQTTADTAFSTHDGVEFTNDGTTKGLRSLYARSAAVIVPLQKVDFTVGFTTILEGMAMGKPVVSVSNPCQGDFVVPGATGVLVPPEDPDALRSALVALLDDRDECRRLGANGRQAVLDRYSIDRYRERISEELAAVGLQARAALRSDQTVT
jgi:glycosyltransferase involved in cell wall biosynthesis